MILLLLILSCALALMTVWGFWQYGKNQRLTAQLLVVGSHVDQFEEAIRAFNDEFAEEKAQRAKLLCNPVQVRKAVRELQELVEGK